jgi:predicted RNA-binding Zn-ribbon protein involved in translation (DUF1610 family)
MKLSPKSQAIILVSCSALAVLIVMGGLLIVPRHAIVVLTIGAALLGAAGLMLMPGLVSTERARRRVMGEGTGAFDASAHRGVCDECGWHWRATDSDTACPRCGSPVEFVRSADSETASA